MNALIKYGMYVVKYAEDSISSLIAKQFLNLLNITTMTNPKLLLEINDFAIQINAFKYEVDKWGRIQIFVRPSLEEKNYIKMEIYKFFLNNLNCLPTINRLDGYQWDDYSGENLSVAFYDSLEERMKEEN